MILLLDLVNILVEWLNCGIISNALTRRACRVTRRDAPRLLSPNVLYEVYSLLCTNGLQHVWCESTDHYGVLVGQCLECHVPCRINQGHPTRGIFYTVL